MFGIELCRLGTPLLEKGGKRFLASSERTWRLNSSFSAFIAALICSRTARFMSLLLACSAPAGFAASCRAVSVAICNRV